VSGSVIRASEERSTRNSLELLNAATEEYERTMDRRVTYYSVANGGSPADLIPPQGIRYDVASPPPPTVPPTPDVPPIGSGVLAWTNLATPYSAVANGLPAESVRPFRRTAQLIWALTQSPASAAIMQKIPESVFRGVRPSGTGTTPTGLRHVVDAWDTPIIAIFPGREANSNGLVDPATNVDADGTIKCDSEWAIPTSGGMRLSCKNRKILWVSAGNDSRFTASGGPSTDNLYSYEP
jgi:hypothetical protein